MKRFKLGIDIGGTFTDLVLLDESTGTLYLGKTLTTYPDPVLGVLNGVQEMAATHGVGISEASTLVHGTTLVTNAVIERKGALTGLITNTGFEDVLEIGREMRYDIYDLFIRMPAPLVQRTMRLGIEGRIDKTGQELTPLNEEGMRLAVDKLVAMGAGAIAVCLLHSYANPAHEKAVAAYIAEKYPLISCSLSCEVLPEIREYERASATTMNAYVQPLIQEYLGKLETQLKILGFEGALHLMISSGRLTTVEGARHSPVQLLESGPAGGAMAGVFFGRLLERPDLLAFDMGGTTAKASLIRKGQPEITHQFEAAREKRFKKGSGLPVRIPVIDLIEIGAGGGSIAQVNELGLLTVGPESAASTPGPACYGRGGTMPTVTDAGLVLGYLNPGYFLGGAMALDTSKAMMAIDVHIARPLGINIYEAAWGIIRLVNENMANAARVYVLEKGLDPRNYAMVAFGGAGPVHAFHVARLLGLKEMIVPAGAGVLSALGFLVSPVAIEKTMSYVCRIDALNWDHLNERLQALVENGLQFLQQAGVAPLQASLQISADMRYQGQGHEINLPLPPLPYSEDMVLQIENAFKQAYAQRYGRSINDMAIETVTWRVVVMGPAPSYTPHQPMVRNVGEMLKGYRDVWCENGFVQTPVYDRYRIPPNTPLQGPCIIEEQESTTVVGAASSCVATETGNLIIGLQPPKSNESIWAN